MRTFKKIALIPALFLIANCGNPGTETGTVGLDGTNVNYGTKPATLNISLVDAPNMDLTVVNVNIKHVELWLSNGSTQKRVIVAAGLGNVDLLTLQNGVSLPIFNSEMPAQVQVRHIRLVLEEEGHFANRIDGTVCHMKTPSGQRSGVKLKMPDAVTMDNGATYSIVVDFDALKSVVQKGNGGCNLKPVLKLKSATKVIVDDDNGDGDTDDGTDDPADDLTDGEEYSNGDDNAPPADDGTGGGDGFDSGSGDDGGEIIDIGDLPIYF